MNVQDFWALNRWVKLLVLLRRVKRPLDRLEKRLQIKTIHPER
jgi:hypothetical protein